MSWLANSPYSQHGGIDQNPANVGFFFLGTRAMNRVTTQTRDSNIENGLGRKTNLLFPVIFGDTQHK